MGRYSDTLSARLRARQVAQDVRHPRGAGVAMWCPACGKQMLVTPRGVAPSLKQQEDAVALHATECELRHLWPAEQRRRRRSIERGAWSALRRAWWRRNRWWVLGVVALLVAAEAAWQIRHWY